MTEHRIIDSSIQAVPKIPIIKLYNNLIVSIQVELTDSMVLKLKDDVATEIDRTGARGLIIDVSGMEIMDSYISRTIRDIALIARLMGVETVICGLKPLISMTLVEMGMELESIVTQLNLEAALEYLMAKKAAQNKAHARVRGQGQGNENE